MAVGLRPGLATLDRKTCYMSVNIMGKQATSVGSQVLARIRRTGARIVFTPSDFADSGPAQRRGSGAEPERARRHHSQTRPWCVHLPRRDARLGDLSPSPDDVVSALAGRDGARLQASGAHAANLLGLSDQVPVRLTFLTDGRSRRLQLGRQQIVLEAHHAPADGNSRPNQRHRHPGAALARSDHADVHVAATLRRRLTDAEQHQLPAGPPFRAHVGRRRHAGELRPQRCVDGHFPRAAPRAPARHLRRGRPTARAQRRQRGKGPLGVLDTPSPVPAAIVDLRPQHRRWYVTLQGLEASTTTVMAPWPTTRVVA